MSKLQKFRKGYLEKFHEPRLISGYSGKVCTDACFMMLEEIPSEYHRVTIKGYNEVLNLNDIKNENDFYVDYTNNYIYFHKSKLGKTITVDDYYGIGLNFIGASRIIVRSNVTEDVIQTLEDLIEQAKLYLEAITTLGGATEVIEQLKEDTETGIEVDKQLQNTIKSGNATIQSIKNTGNKSFIVNKTDWTSTTNGYKYTLTHNLQSIDLHVSMIDLTDNMAYPSQYKIINVNTIEVYAIEQIKANIVISARYYNGLGENVGDKIVQEVVDARGGMISLGDKIRDMNKQLVTEIDNKAEQTYVDEKNNDINNKLLKLEDKILGINNLQYATVSTSVSPTERPSIDYDYNHIIYQGMDLVLCIMVNITENTDYTPKIMDNSRVETVIQDAIDKGIKIQMLKPHIGLNWSDGYNRKNYTPSNLDTFFTNWTNVLLNYATMCNKYNIPILCISCEMSKLTVNSNLSYWKNVYDTIKSQYPNLLLLHAPKTGDFNDPNCNKTWQYSDILGVNIYLSYTYKRFTNDEEGLDIKDIAKGFYEDQRGNRMINNINTLSEKYDKPVFITEIGCMPWDDGLIDVRCEKKVQNWYVPKYLAESAVTYLCNNKHVIGFSWWHTNSPFNYYSDKERLPLEEYFRKTFGGGI